MAVTSIASIQGVLDTTAQGLGVRIVRSVRIASNVESRYVVPVVTSHGQAGWINTSVTSSASAISTTIKNAIPTNGAAPRYPST